MNLKKFWPVKRNWATRLLALLLAVLIIVLLFLLVDRQVGNPLGCWYTEKKIQAHYRAYHSGRPYVVGPAQFTYADGAMRYVCHIYLQGSIDTGFLAYFQDGAVLSTEKAETLSGNNTYNRFRLRLNEDMITKELLKQAQTGEFPVSRLTAEFHPGDRQMAFDLSNPVFQVDAVYDPEHLPLPTLLYAEFYSEAKNRTEEKDIAARLRYLNDLAEKNHKKFDYYSLQWYDGTTFWTVLDIPAAVIAQPPAEDGTDALLAYLKNLPSSHKVNYYPENSLAQQKSRVLYLQGTGFLPCTEHAG